MCTPPTPHPPDTHLGTTVLTCMSFSWLWCSKINTRSWSSSTVPWRRLFSSTMALRRCSSSCFLSVSILIWKGSWEWVGRIKEPQEARLNCDLFSVWKTAALLFIGKEAETGETACTCNQRLAPEESEWNKSVCLPPHPLHKLAEEEWEEETLEGWNVCCQAKEEEARGKVRPLCSLEFPRDKAKEGHPVPLPGHWRITLLHSRIQGLQNTGLLIFFFSKHGEFPKSSFRVWEQWSVLQEKGSENLVELWACKYVRQSPFTIPDKDPPNPFSSYRQQTVFGNLQAGHKRDSTQSPAICYRDLVFSGIMLPYVEILSNYQGHW